ncbi:MAG: hypothetical protein ABSA01_04490 [Anaerolineales bacterium]
MKKSLLIFVLLGCLVLPASSVSAAVPGTLPGFSVFVSSVADGQAKIVSGVYVPGTLALRVVQQRGDDPESVLRIRGVATQFGLAAHNHVIGLLAHDDLAGAFFSYLEMGQEVRNVYGDGRVEYYQINRLDRFKAPQPGSQNGNYVELSSIITYTALDFFTMFYNGVAHVSFQTCILHDGKLSWGRSFATVMPVFSINLPNSQSLAGQTGQNLIKPANMFHLPFGGMVFG